MTKKAAELFEDLEKLAVDMAKNDAHLTDQINRLVKERNTLRIERRRIELKITNRRISSQV